MSSMNARTRTRTNFGMMLFSRLTVGAMLVLGCAGTTGCGGGGGPVVIQQPAPQPGTPLTPTTPTTITAVPTPTTTPTTSVTPVPTTTPTTPVPTTLATPIPTPVPTLVPVDPTLVPPTALPPGTGGVVIIKKKVTKEITIIKPIGTGQWGTPGADGAQPLPAENATCYTQQDALLAAITRYNTEKNTRRTLIDSAFLNELVAGQYLAAIPGDAASFSWVTVQNASGSVERITCSIHGCREAPVIK